MAILQPLTLPQEIDHETLPARFIVCGLAPSDLGVGNALLCSVNLSLNIEVRLRPEKIRLPPTLTEEEAALGLLGLNLQAVYINQLAIALLSLIMETTLVIRIDCTVGTPLLAG